ncbi:MAG: 1-acyl-sn-glycerol-3-phosphate acyltransferase [Oscillospiraceae bacterium]|nr:1-acyl-sn-glycerol-3-phosphate acyltransferase [Oscillospiraceae bacterium]
MIFYSFCKNLCAVFMHIYYNIKFVGRENIPPSGGLIMAANHRSLFDPILLGIGLRRQVRYMAKNSVLDAPVIGLITRNLGTFHAQKTVDGVTSVERSVGIVNEGGLLALFPEGHRSPTEQLLRPRTGVAVIAEKSGGDILPVGIRYAKKGRFRSKVTINYGQIIPNNQLFAGNLNTSRSRAEFIMTKIAELM